MAESSERRPRSIAERLGITIYADGEKAAVTDLPPFSGDAARCGKCLYDSVRAEYRDTRCTPMPNGAHMAAASFSGRPEHEHLHRQCGRCGYSWDEALPSTPRAATPAVPVDPMTG